MAKKRGAIHGSKSKALTKRQVSNSRKGKHKKYLSDQVLGPVAPALRQGASVLDAGAPTKKRRGGLVGFWGDILGGRL